MSGNCILTQGSITGAPKYVLYLQGGEQAANQANSTAYASAKQSQAKQSNSSLQGILPFLPVIFVLLAVLVGYQFLGKQ